MIFLIWKQAGLNNVLILGAFFKKTKHNATPVIPVYFLNLTTR